MSSTSSKRRIERTTPPTSLEWQGERLVVIGELVGTHGVRGELRLRLFNLASRVLAGIETLFLLEATPRPTTLEGARRHGRVWLIRIDGVASPEVGRELVGCSVAIRERELEPLGESEYYPYQLIGLSVVDLAGTRLGSVTEVISTGGTDVLTIETDRGERMIPLVDEIVRRIDLGSRRIVVRAIDGLLEG